MAAPVPASAQGAHRVLRVRGVHCIVLMVFSVVAATAIAQPAPAQISARLVPRVRLFKVATAKDPIGFARHPDGTVYVQEQAGRLRPLKGSRLETPVLDVSALITSGGERGLLGAAFSPDGATLYTNVTNLDGDTEIAAWPFAGADTPIDPANKKLLLLIEQPFSNHNGGQLWVTDDGVLWIGTGDGGSGGDPQNNAQRLDSLLGKILRIAPTNASGRGYDIPQGNMSGEGVRAEIWAYGLRNPWRFSIDEPTQTLWIGDVGQNEREEIDAVPVNTTAANFGWRLREGTRAYDNGARPPGGIEPVHDYPHSRGCSVTGGVVYRGKAVKAMVGAYLFADYCKGDLRSLVRRDATWQEQSLGVNLGKPVAFVTERNGEVLVASADGGIRRIVPR